MDSPRSPHPPAPATVPAPQAIHPCAFDFGAASDVGNERPNNEDAHGHLVESEVSLVCVVADGVGGVEGGEEASKMAVEVTLSAYQESPPAWGAGKRLARAVQRANIEIHDRALIVPELARMATTVTAVSVSNGVLNAAHVGDCRIYLVRDGRVVQLTRDHTVAARRARLGLMTKAEASRHPDRGTLTRSVGPELIVAVDRITTPLVESDVVIVCSDGLYTTLEEEDFERCTNDRGASEACRALIDTANERGTIDNLTVALVRIIGPTPSANLPRGWRARFQKLFGR
jgi:serine/threonine protein phosphatase PrpC